MPADQETVDAVSGDQETFDSSIIDAYYPLTRLRQPGLPVTLIALSGVVNRGQCLNHRHPFTARTAGAHCVPP